MIKIKTSDLTGAALDYMVEIAVVGGKQSDKHAFAWRYQNNERKDYSTRWRDCGPLIEKYRIDLSSPPEHYDGGWDARLEPCESCGKLAETSFLGWSNGATLLIAACRAICHAKLGETVLVPKELIS